MKMFFRKASIRLLLRSRGQVQNYSNATSAIIKDGGFPNYSVKKTPGDLIKEALATVNLAKMEDWDQVKQFMLTEGNTYTIRDDNIDAIIMLAISKLNRPDLAKSYFGYLTSKGTKPNLATTGRYLSILYENSKENVSKANEAEILAICTNLQQSHPVLDSGTLSHIVRGLSLTKDWKKCIEIMQEIKRTSTVSNGAYNAVVAAAFRNKEEPLAWNLLQEALSLERALSSTPFLAYLNTLKKQRKRENILKNIEKLLMFFKESEIHCHEEVADDLIQTFNFGKKTTVKFSGKCEACGAKLDKLELTDEEFDELRAVFFQNAIVGKDIFIKSNPEEMMRFQDFVTNMHKHDVVLDGLNVAYSTGVKGGPQWFSKILANVVTHFRQQNKTVLVLGRAHMTRWPRANWNFIKQNASVFLTQNISQDDPYLLYCALKSGKETIVVTRDLMRGHKFLLKNRKYKVLFERWLTQRQFFLLNVDERGRVTLRQPPHFSPVAQRSQKTWHVPYTPQGDQEINESYHKTWICLDFS